MRPSAISNPPRHFGRRLGVAQVKAGAAEANGYLVWDIKQRCALILDPGDEGDRFLERLRRQRLTLAGIINTHGHADHIGANGAVKQATGADLHIHPADRPMLVDPARNLSQYMGTPVKSPDADQELTAGQVLRLGRLTFEVLATPGHTPGSICVYGEGVLFSGDTLFAGSVGRTDLPGGSLLDLRASLRRLRDLPGATLVYPGHGAATTIERERRVNPFMLEA